MGEAKINIWKFNHKKKFRGNFCQSRRNNMNKAIIRMRKNIQIQVPGGNVYVTQKILSTGETVYVTHTNPSTGGKYVCYTENAEYPGNCVCYTANSEYRGNCVCYTANSEYRRNVYITQKILSTWGMSYRKLWAPVGLILHRNFWVPS
jgi:hypothetical protein